MLHDEAARRVPGGTSHAADLLICCTTASASCSWPVTGQYSTRTVLDCTVESACEDFDSWLAALRQPARQSRVLRATVILRVRLAGMPTPTPLGAGTRGVSHTRSTRSSCSSDVGTETATVLVRRRSCLLLLLAAACCCCAALRCSLGSPAPRHHFVSSAKNYVFPRSELLNRSTPPLSYSPPLPY
jgi:hypothetical protein